MAFIQQENQLVCSCGNDIFISHGDEFGFTVVECKKCGSRTSIMNSTLIAVKLLSAYGEDFCRIFGNIIDDIVMVDYLLFTEFDTAVIISPYHRLDRIISAKQEAVSNQWFERATRLRDEERIIHRALQRQSKFSYTKIW